MTLISKKDYTDFFVGVFIGEIGNFKICVISEYYPK
jgi:hypothetical protein